MLRGALVCRIEIPVHHSDSTAHLWVVNLALDEESEEVRQRQVVSLLDQAMEKEPSFAAAHVLCGGFNRYICDNE